MEEKVNKTTAAKNGKIRGRVEIDIQRCKGCELCTAACKEKALTLSETINIKGYRYIISNNERCTGCVNCALVCPDAVITVYRTHPTKKPVKLTPEDISKQLLPDTGPPK
jgi:2-oxoglutarate ferredoxin oxidoreductase subunit delta